MSTDSLKAEIYALHCPITNEIRYIGKANDSQKRFKKHLSETRRNYPVYCWIRSLWGKGLVPELSILMYSDNWIEDEKRLIAEHREKGTRLLNIANGGDQPKCGYATLASNGRKNCASIQSDPKRKRMHDLKKMFVQGLRFMTPESRDKLYNKILNYGSPYQQSVLEKSH